MKKYTKEELERMLDEELAQIEAEMYAEDWREELIAKIIGRN
jgi:hypothetical protein